MKKKRKNRWIFAGAGDSDEGARRRGPGRAAVRRAAVRHPARARGTPPRGRRRGRDQLGVRTGRRPAAPAGPARHRRRSRLGPVAPARPGTLGTQVSGEPFFPCFVTLPIPRRFHYEKKWQTPIS